MRPLTANGQPAVAAYAPDPADPQGGLRLHTLQVFTVLGGLVTCNVVFSGPGVLESFDLPHRLPRAE
jgi:RNA polymerase sigma-70 factor (ECF subfamily)